MNTQKEIILQSFGADETVTGSKHLLRTPEITIMIDCGLFQGLKELRLKNWNNPLFNPADVDVLILTHAHLDHCGYIPLLVKNGFKGKIFMTPPTKELTEIILRDSAKIQEEDAEKANRFAYTKHEPALPLYTLEDAEACFKQFVTIEHSVETELSPNIKFQFRKNGHILGSCFVYMDCYDKKIVFSGDIGRFTSDFLFPPSYIDEADYVIMESTYGDRLHGVANPGEQLAKVIFDTIHNHGNILIPCFAVGRAQELMNILNELKKQNKIAYNIPIYLDSPMAANATDILCKFPHWHKLSHDQCTSLCKDIIINRDYTATAGILKDPHSKIVLSASGMLTGGRVLEYMKHYAPDKKNTILLIGYQAEGTRGRALKEGAKEVKIHGKYVQVKAKVVEISGLSAHADQGELIQWLKGFQQKPKQIFLVHGEVDVLKIFSNKIKEEIGVGVTIVKEAESNILFSI